MMQYIPKDSKEQRISKVLQNGISKCSSVRPRRMATSFFDKLWVANKIYLIPVVLRFHTGIRRSGDQSIIQEAIELSIVGE